MNENNKITENKPDVPFIVYEGEMARAERYIKRLWTALIISIISLGVAVIAFMWYLSMYDFASYDYEQTGEGVNIVGNENGVDFNGTESDSQAENSQGWKSDR
ncbi:MAG: hypothetical protein IJ740_08270 [Ruminococcus sp.]|nr:hypothetical protein [Ruminococcus sp.]